jgi:hypothetical protein
MLLNTFTADKRHTDDKEFLRFRRQLFHDSLAHILRSVRPSITNPEVALTPDGHFRRVVYSIGPYIADYPEQALLACVVQGWCPRYVASSCTLFFLTSFIEVVQHGLKTSMSVANAGHNN